jgi:hypothetical protein
METSPLPVKGCIIYRPKLGAQAFEQGRIFIVPNLL